eukprot:CAMPEP_0206138478 /NCGR_PEP_ID=MMETSP1473-20131121/3353_1 /ASSEMBLY_ACC=CAM_ASM_001109 /TAXON_ID=1461547 /ORGANISM="Stichococcus sp, Strain RCC1054" /LENGTH=160 /DNA_ID=CAMNT_0053531923 /DNA_START=35 /DNA_END=517 /DNA_ORIENTATION=+
MSTKDTPSGLGPLKLTNRFLGPFPVTAVINPVAFRLDLPRHWRIHNIFHVSRLAPFTPPKRQDAIRQEQQQHGRQQHQSPSDDDHDRRDDETDQDPPKQPPPIDDPATGQAYVAEKILGWRYGKNRQWEVVVEWAVYDISELRYEPYRNLNPALSVAGGR